MTNDHVQAVILAGGASFRFTPFNQKSKALFRLKGKSILRHTIEDLRKIGTKRVSVVVPEGNERFKEEVGSGSDMGIEISYCIQKEPKGQADAMLSVWKTGDQKRPMVVLNAQHFTASSVIPHLIMEYEEQKKNVILTTATDTPWKYGIASVNGSDVTSVVEKPEKGIEPSNMRIVGIYLLTPAFMEFLSQQTPSEYALELTLDKVAKQGKLRHVTTNTLMPSLKYPWDLFGIKDLLLKNDQYIDKSAFVHKTAVIEGPCWVGPHAVVGAFCMLRKGVILEEGAEVQRYVEVKNVIIGKDSHIHSGYIGDSAVGEHCRIGAGFITANRRFDRRTILIEVKGKKVDTGLSFLGVFIGDNAAIGIHVGTMPGTVIETQRTILPGAIVKGKI